MSADDARPDDAGDAAATVDAAADATIDAAIRTRVVAARPELDAVARSVMRANAAVALFGKPAAVTIGRYQLVREVGSGGGGIVFLATDPELNRPVAVKLIGAGAPAVRARAVAEGRALARLSHPHVVQVFDVGVVDDRVYLVMELVQGESLRAYAERASVRDVIRAYRQAGDGLVAAHDAGLVHRDFKPDNAMRGSDGRVRVVDFGLAGAEGDEAAGGTPKYMAPEQAARGAVTAAADQYAFAASLGEAVGRAGGAPVPRWVAAIVDRGTAPDPAARFPSMRELSRALANDPRTRWRRRALVAAPVVLGVVGFAVGRRSDESAPVRCDQGAAAVAPAWTAARSAAADVHVTGLATPFATAAALRTRAALSDYAARWARGFDAACLAARREPSATVVARRSACLASARTQLGAAVDLITTVDAVALPDAIRAVAELPDLDRCADAAALVVDIAPPAPAQAAEAARITDELDRARVEIEAALPSSTTRTETALAHARALGYRPLLAVALLDHGRAELARDQRDAAVAPLAEAAREAIAVGDIATAVEASARAAWARLATGTAPDPALAGLDLVLAISERLGERDRFARALLFNNVGVIENAAGRIEAARHRLTAALALARQVTGPGVVELANVRANLARVTADPVEREAYLAEATATVAAKLGPDHPAVLVAQIAEAFGIDDDARARAALRPPCTAMVELHPDHRATIVECGSELAWLDVAAGDTAAAGTALAVVIAANAEGVDRDRVAVARAYRALLGGHPHTADAELRAIASRLAPTADTAWWQLLFAAEVELGRVVVADAAEHADTAAAALTRAIGFLERAAAVQAQPTITRRLRWARQRRDHGRTVIHSP